MVQTIDSIRVECSCGKKARVPARYAGRRVRCTRCKNQLRVPGSGSSLDALDREVARTTPTKGPLRAERRASSPTPARSRATNKSADPYAPPKATVDAPRPRHDRGAANRDLSAEGHIQALGVWQRIYGVLAVVGAAAMLLFGGVRSLPFVAIIGGVGVFSYFLGQSLTTYRGWARVVVGLFTGLGLLGCVAGMVAEPNAGGIFSNLLSGAWNCAILWALFSPRAARVFSPGYRMDQRRVRWWWSPFFWLPFVLFGLVFVMAFGAVALSL